MRKDKKLAIQLRSAGRSYREIHEALAIPRSTLSGWFGGAAWSDRIRKKVTSEAQVQSTLRLVALNKIRGTQLRKAYEQAVQEARNELEYLKYNPLFIAGLMLYWGEGDKLTKGKTRLINTDPELIRLFVLFLTKACLIPPDKISAQILIYPDLADEVCRSYWAQESGLSASQFGKSTVIQGKHKTRRLPYGICIICVSSTYFKTKIKEWTYLLPKELMNREYYENI